MKYIHHFQLLSAATYKLCQKSMTIEEVNDAGRRFNQFADQFEEFYGAENVTMNIHLLRHVADEVRKSGPLWAYSMFGFEAMNGVLVKSVKGPSSVIQQITKRYILKQTLAGMEKKVKAESKIEYYKKIQVVPSNDEKILLSNHSISFDEITCWEAININGERYKSIKCKETNFIDCFVEFSNESMGKIKYFVQCENLCYAIVEVFTTEKTIDHLKEVTTTNVLSLVPAKDIREKLMYIHENWF